MPFPGPNVHRVNTRRNSRGNPLRGAPVHFVLTPSGDNVLITFSSNVIITGFLDLHINTLTLTTQTITAPNAALLTFSGAVASKQYQFKPESGTARSVNGGPLLGGSGTF